MSELLARYRQSRVPESTGADMASAVFPNRREAEIAVERLVAGGFAPRSIQLDPLFSNSKEFEVLVSAGPADFGRAEDLLHGRRENRPFASDSIDVGPLLLLVAALGIGTLGYALYAVRPARRWAA
jgi:hypothetical protein